MRAVNLLPDERRKREHSTPKLTPLHGAALGILAGALALGYWGHSIHGQVDQQTAKLVELQQQTDTLTAQIVQAKASSSTQVSTYEADRALVTGLTQARVNWSTVMINLSRIAPSDVWLKSMAVTAPTGDAATQTPTGNAERPPAITLEASAKSRTSAALFISRLAAIPGFVEPRLAGGINPEGDTGIYSFSVDIPVDDGLFGSSRPVAAAPAAAGTTPATPTPQSP